MTVLYAYYNDMYRVGVLKVTMTLSDFSPYLQVASLAITKLCKKPENDWNPGTRVLIW